MLLMGWLLPWFVEPTSSGIGFSPQDAVLSAPMGPGAFLLYVLAVTMLLLVLSPLAEIAARITKRPLPLIADRVRLVVAVVGFVLTLVVWFRSEERRVGKECGAGVA